jgi:hypothetical protein
MTVAGVVSPFTSCELRWFLDGDSAQHAEIRRWFTECAPFSKERAVGPPEWQGRLGGEPDVYLLLPGYVDTGIKWREGTLQIKGLVQGLGPRSFAGRHEGRVECWIKWTYEELPPAYRSLFGSKTADDLVTVCVHKTRALRMFRLNDQDEPTEAPLGEFLERGLGFEITDLEVDARRYCSVAFEAFPDDALMPEQFIRTVGRLLEGLVDDRLTIEQSLSYPSWLMPGSRRRHQLP